MTTHIRDVTYRYPTSRPGAPAPITNLNLRIEPGESVLICGGSGSGKSSVIRLLNGLIPKYHEGELTGQVVHTSSDGSEHVISEEELFETGRFTATVFQNPRTQFFTTNVTSELAFACENYGMDPQEIQERIVRVVNEIAIPHLLGKNLFHISGGEKQRVACGCSMMSEPDLYLFDEPTSNLSPQAIDEFREVYVSLRRKGATLVVAEHRLYFLRGLVDRMIIMADGRIEKEMTADEFWAMSEAERAQYGLRDLTAPPKPQLPTIVANGGPTEHPPLDAAAIPPECLQRDPMATTVDSHNGDLSADTSEAGAVEIRNLRFSYGKKTVLDIPELSLPAGKVIIVAGPNGAGKSTFASVLTGLEKARGTISYRGEKLTPKKRLAHSYMVMQDVHRQLFGTTVRGEVTVDSATSSIDPAQVDDLLKGFDLLHLADRHPMSLSGGQKQRVVIATAKACQKDIVVFDEPSSGLDYQHMVAIAHALRELAAQGKVVLVITHDFELMNLCGDLILHLNKLSEDG